jgi:hypothetical protein
MRRLLLAAMVAAGVVILSPMPGVASCPYCDFQTALCLGSDGSTLCVRCTQLNPGCYCNGGECNPEGPILSSLAPDGSLRLATAPVGDLRRYESGVG